MREKILFAEGWRFHCGDLPKRDTVMNGPDYGLTGDVVPYNVYKYRIEFIKEMGANSYRTSHYPHAEATINALDEILVMDETRWYELTEAGAAQIETLIKRDRNHSPVILWLVGNEELYHSKEQDRKIAEI